LILTGPHQAVPVFPGDLVSNFPPQPSARCSEKQRDSLKKVIAMSLHAVLPHYIPVLILISL